MIDAHLHLTHNGRSVEETITHIEAIGAEKAVMLPIEDGDDEFGYWQTIPICLPIYPQARVWAA